MERGGSLGFLLSERTSGVSSVIFYHCNTLFIFGFFESNKQLVVKVFEWNGQLPWMSSFYFRLGEHRLALNICWHLWKLIVTMLVFYIFISKAPLLRFSFFVPLESRPLLGNCPLLLHKAIQCTPIYLRIFFAYLSHFSRMLKLPEMTTFTFTYYIIMYMHGHFFSPKLNWRPLVHSKMFGG